jgi:cholesterol transport system auxiliary component
MKIPIPIPIRMPIRMSLLTLLASLLCACSSLLPSPPPTPSFYTLGNSVKATPVDLNVKVTGPTLLVNPMRAASGFDSSNMVYTRRAQQLEHFARNEWADTPARMLAPWLVQVLSDELVRSASVGAVLLAPSSAASEYTVDTELIRLQQDFSMQPSQVRLTLRVALIQTTTKRVLGVREFDASQAAETDDPLGGVQAAQAASARVLQEVAEFCKAALPPK